MRKLLASAFLLGVVVTGLSIMVGDTTTNVAVEVGPPAHVITNGI